MTTEQLPPGVFVARNTPSTLAERHYQVSLGEGVFYLVEFASIPSFSTDKLYKDLVSKLEGTA